MKIKSLSHLVALKKKSEIIKEAVKEVPAEKDEFGIVIKEAIPAIPEEKRFLIFKSVALTIPVISISLNVAIPETFNSSRLRLSVPSKL